MLSDSGLISRKGTKEQSGKGKLSKNNIFKLLYSFAPLFLCVKLILSQTKFALNISKIKKNIL